MTVVGEAVRSSRTFLVLHLCSGEPTLSVAIRDDVPRCVDDPPPWYITEVGGWRVYPYQILQELSGNLYDPPPPDAIDIFTGTRVIHDAPKVDLVALLRKHRPVQPLKRRI